jgi:hypothetical protein
VLAVAVLAALAASGCGDDTPRSAARDTGAPAVDGAPHQARWLELSNPLSPAQWMASRGAPAPKPHHDPEVRRLVELLAAAHARYRESERMIANRAVQLSDMLRPLGIEESPGAILDDLVGVAGEIGQTEGFGAVSQHYFNLRAANLARPDALATLKARYGSRS